MSKFCSNCGASIQPDDRFCNVCGMKIGTQTAPIEKTVSQPARQLQKVDKELITAANKKIKVQNSQNKVVKYALWLALISLFLVVLTMVEGNPLYEVFAITIIGIWLFITALIVAWVFKSRSKKLESLITGENVLASWQLAGMLKKQYVDQFFTKEKGKNTILFTIVTVFSVLIFGGFIVFMDEGKGFMAIAMFLLIGIVGFFAFVMPRHYRNKNLKGDGMVLIGKKFAYINGYFHNWDFPLSGLEKVKTLQKPFYGLHLTYYYTDRTLTNREELNIPAPREIDIEELVTKLTA